MHQTQLKNQTTIRVISPDEVVVVPTGQIRSDRDDGLPGNCFVVPMVILEEPEPIKQPPPRSR
jgi:hypothetical protein